MIENALIQLTFYMAVLLLAVKPLGLYMARVYEGRWAFLRPIETSFYRLLGTKPDSEMGWRTYAVAALLFNLLGLVAVYLLQRLQGGLPLNPDGMGNVAPLAALNVAISFATNTNWQNYGGEATLSYLTQMLALTVQNFLSAATGMAILVAFARGLARKSSATLGNFWVDMTRSVLYILLPLSLILALLLVSQGVVQTFDGAKSATLIQPAADGTSEQLIPVAPAASQVAIKQLGTNGGGVFNVNSAHPLENPTPLSNFLQVLAILLLPAALCYTFGVLVEDRRQGWALLAAMTLIFLPLLGLAVWAEQQANPLWESLPLDASASDLQAGGNMEGKETRFGIINSALWATATTAASNGSVNAMHDSFSPLGGFVPLFLMQMGEVIYGGIGSGLYGMLIFTLIAVFVAGLMVGRTPEYLGKKIEPFEMKMASLVILIPILLVLVGTAITVATDEGRLSIQDGGPHGLSEVLYAYSSAGNNNGSAFGGFNATTDLQNVLLGVAMFIARYGVALPVLAIAGALAAKKKVPPSAGTLPSHNALFIAWLILVVLIVGALSYLPALALGPLVEHLLLQNGLQF